MKQKYTQLTIYSTALTTDHSTVWSDAAASVVSHFLSPQIETYKKYVGEFNVISVAFVPCSEQPSEKVTQYHIEMVIEVHSHELTQRILAGINIEDYFIKRISDLLSMSIMAEISKLFAKHTK